jgi:uroporphyrin-3 C-methyltransferase/uroporphyrinogen III methyltransferase/synthase
VTIRRSDEVERPLVNPQQRALLQERLQLKLETARLAALGHNQALYLASLGETDTLLRRYFDMEAAEVGQALTELDALQALNADQAPPSLMPLRQQLQAISATATAAPPAVAPAQQSDGSTASPEAATAEGAAMESQP